MDDSFPEELFGHNKEETGRLNVVRCMLNHRQAYSKRSPCLNLPKFDGCHMYWFMPVFLSVRQSAANFLYANSSPSNAQPGEDDKPSGNVRHVLHPWCLVHLVTEYVLIHIGRTLEEKQGFLVYHAVTISLSATCKRQLVLFVTFLF